MTRKQRITTYLATATALAGTALAAGATSAGAATARLEGNSPVVLPGCAVVQEIQLQGSPAHDHMRWETEGDSQGCHAWIQDDAGNRAAVIESQQITTAGYHHSSWYYDGPGHLMTVCVQRGTDSACGPTN
ncbi:hypothetical protein [Streptomyces sp. NBC_00448]|uniref:hypothetical protein n=1 Tax=Streptomyces sp. NBC_00448 TaxID=2903652 RepID=UPI002E1F250D